MQRFKLWLLLASVCLCFVGGQSASAQTNLLTNPSLENGGDFGNYRFIRSDGTDPTQFNPGGTNFNVPGGWGGWILDDGAGPQVLPNAFPHSGMHKLVGNFSMDIQRGGALFTAAVYQTVSVSPGTNVVGSAYLLIRRNTTVGGQARVGIDTAGGTNPNASTVLWSNWLTEANQWRELTVNATASGSAVTLFVYVTQVEGAVDPNSFFIDEARLQPGGGGGTAVGTTGTPPPGATAVPTQPPPPPAEVPFVSPQGEQPDGSIVHTVQAGDTINSIAVAYGVTAQTIQELNGIANPRFIFVGQRLIIRPAPGGASSGGSATPRPTGTRGTSVAALASNTPAQAAETTEEPAEATPEASSTPRILATNTPVPSPTDAATAPVVQVSDNVVDPAQTTASLCALMYEDANQNLGQDNDEQALAGGLFTLNSEGVSIDAKESTVDRVCFEGLAPGDYTVIANAPDGYGVTTPDQLSINLTPGEPLNVAFGAAQGFSAVIPTADAQNVQQPEPAEQAQTQSFTDRLFAISGFLVIGLGVLVIIGGVVATLILRRR